MASILVADDDPDILFLMALVLSRAGHRVTAVADGQAALRAVELRDFDVVVLDQQMPGLTGLEVIVHSSRLGRPDGPPVLVVSAQHDPSLVVAVTDAGAVDFLGKPFRLAVLQERVARRLPLPDPAHDPDPDAGEDRS
ncbi:Transcriptional regulatory protein TcrA [Nocardioides aquaticus]|uniref:Transcriptional regulatory protein TcrA n=1 Tax=Nocardioides aquaticus TaxID=160826 RepID=A0ABX8EL24_9ACTN|nr:response regulator [Nocardioides aquaticus]QVT79763.1 Transcriptional regulatory protein TcrA [Nocardioides aquaticus]